MSRYIDGGDDHITKMDRHSSVYIGGKQIHFQKEYFWRHKLIPSTLFHFPALLDHIVSCKVVAYVYFCVHLCVCEWVCV